MTDGPKRNDYYNKPHPSHGRYTSGSWVVSLNGRCVPKGEKVQVYTWEDGALTYEALNAARNGYVPVDFSRADIQSVGDVYKFLGHETTFTCKECGREEEPSQWSHGAHLKRIEECMHCNVWLDRIRRQDTDPNVIDQDWNLYGIGKEPSLNEKGHVKGERAGLGYGGRRFVFQPVNDLEAKCLVSHNVWFGGKVPERFRNRLLQTHELVPEAAADSLLKLPDFTKGD